MTIKAEIRNKAIEMAKEGKGRNRIAHELGIGQGTVSDILKKSRESDSNPITISSPTSQPEMSVCIEQREQSLKPYANCNETVLQPDANISTGISLKETSPPSLKSHDVGVGLASFIPTNFTSTSIHSPKPRDGGPLSHLIVEDFIEDNSPLPKLKTQVNINNNGKYLNNQHETIKEEKQSQYRTLLSNVKDSSRCCEDNRREEDQEKKSINLEESKISLESEEVEQSDKPDITLPKTDWDSNAIWEQKLIRAWRERSQQIRLIEDGKLKLEEEREAIESMKETVRLEMNDLKVEKDKLAEIEPQIPLARQFQAMRISVTTFMPWSDLVHGYAINHNTDLTTAAFNVKKILEAFGELETMWSFARKQDNIISAQAAVIRTNKIALATLKTLHGLGYTKKNIQDLTDLINMWNRGDFNINRKLDDELYIERERKNSSPVFNGSSRHSMREFIRSNMLK